MHARRLALRGWIAVATLALVAGCGGSGSSGFDPSFLEGLAIEQALGEQSCVPHDELVICAAGVATPLPGSGAPGLGELTVDANVGAGGFAGCSRANLDACRLTIDVSAAGVPPGAELRVAVRLLPDGAWRIGDAFSLQATNGGSTDAPTPVGLDVGPRGPEQAEVQVAVLVFPVPAASLPAEVDVLATTGARWVFVLPPQAVGA